MLLQPHCHPNPHAPAMSSQRASPSTCLPEHSFCGPAQVGADGDALNGWVSDAQLAAQITSLNLAFAPLAVTFVAAGISRIKGHGEWWCAHGPCPRDAQANDALFTHTLASHICLEIFTSPSHHRLHGTQEYRLRYQRCGGFQERCVPRHIWGPELLRDSAQERRPGVSLTPCASS